MLKRVYKDQRGMAALWAAVIMMVMLALAGLVADGGIMIYNKIRLEAATDSAAHATREAYDRELWNNYGIVELDPLQAMLYAQIMLSENFPEAILESCEVDPINKDTATVKTRIEVETVFMKIFGIDKRIIRSTVYNKVS
ncbi:MAG: TadE/TadG family type IV pilus assembly protein [Bacillota bacterium]